MADRSEIRTEDKDSKLKLRDEQRTEQNNNDELDNENSMSNLTGLSLDIVSQRICQVISPVIICSLYACLLIRLLENNSHETTNLLSRAWSRMGLKPIDDENTSMSELLLSNIVIVTIFTLMIIILTLIVLLIFYMEWHSCLNYYFYLPSLLIMALITPIFIRQIFLSLGLFSIDKITLLIFQWNFTVLGMISIYNLYAKGPLYIKQFYLIHNSALLAVLIIFILPLWAAWLLLVFLVAWDLFAVLSPYGPLNLIINMAEREGIIEMPGLIYQTDAELSHSKSSKSVEDANVSVNVVDTNSKNQTKELQPTKESNSIKAIMPKSNIEQSKQSNSNEENKSDQTTIKSQSHNSKSETSHESMRRGMVDRGVNIGLGDFVFYSLLVGLTCKGSENVNFHTTLACLLAIVIGLILTLMILALTRRALPALPISIAIGIIVAALTSNLVPPLSNRLSAEQVFV